MRIAKMGNRKILNLALLTVLTLAIVLSRPFAFSSSPIEIYVSPQPIFVEEDESFSISISISNVPPPGIFSYQMALCYDPDCLEATHAEIPEGHFLTPSSPEGIIIVRGGTIDNVSGEVTFALSLLAPEEGKTGSGVMACVEFRAVATGNSSLTFAGIILVTPECIEIPSSQYVLEHGVVNVVSGAPPPPSSPFKVYVSPELSFVEVGQTLSISMKIAKAPLPGIFAYKLSLHCNCTILQAITAGIPERNFLDTSAPETLSIIDNGTIDNISGLVSFEATRLVPEEGKTGNGVLGCIEFIAVASGNSSLTIATITLTDQEGNLFPSSQYEQVNGSVVVTSYPTPTPPTPLLPTEIYMSPMQSPIAVNGSFEINIFIANVSYPGLYGYQLALHYDCALLEAVNAEIPEGHFLTPLSPENIIIVDGGTIDNTLGRVSFALNLLAPEGGKTGDGVLATIRFKAIAAGNVTLQLEDVILCGPTPSEFTDYEVSTDCNVNVVPEFASVVMLQMLLLLATLVILIAKKARTHHFA